MANKIILKHKTSAGAPVSLDAGELALNSYNGILYASINGAAPTQINEIIAAGTTSQYWRGDKTWQTLPVLNSYAQAMDQHTYQAAAPTFNGLTLGNASTGLPLNFTGKTSVSYWGGINLTSANTTWTAVSLYNTDTGGRNWHMVTTGSASSLGAGAFGIYDYNAGLYRLTISTDGLVTVKASHLSVDAGNLHTNRGRVAFSSTPGDANHSIYNNNSNIDAEGAWDGMKMNVYAGLLVRTGSYTAPVTALAVMPGGIYAHQTGSWDISVGHQFRNPNAAASGSPVWAFNINSTSSQYGHLLLLTTGVAAGSGFDLIRAETDHATLGGVGTAPKFIVRGDGKTNITTSIDPGLSIVSSTHQGIHRYAATGNYVYDRMFVNSVAMVEAGIEPAGNYYINRNTAAGAAGAGFYIRKSDNFVGISDVAPESLFSVTGGAINSKSLASGGVNLIMSGNYVTAYRWRFKTVDRGSGIDWDITSSNVSDAETLIASFTNESTSGRPALTVYGTFVSGAHTVGGALLPSANNTYDLGAIGTRWKDLYLSGNAYIGGEFVVTNYSTCNGGLSIVGPSSVQCLNIGSANTTATSCIVGNTSTGGLVWGLYSTGSASSIGVGKWGIYGGTYGYTLIGDNSGVITIPGQVELGGVNGTTSFVEIKLRNAPDWHNAWSVPSSLYFGASGGAYVRYYATRNAGNTYNNSIITFGVHEGGIFQGEVARFSEKKNFLIGSTTDIDNSSKLQVTGVARVITSGVGTWQSIFLTSSDKWDDSGTQYACIGDGGAAGIMLYNPHVVWNAGTACAGIRLGRANGVSTGKYWEIGTRSDDTFSFKYEAGGTAPLQLGNGSVTIDPYLSIVSAGAGRPLTLSASAGNIRIKADAGGWAMGYFFNGSAGTDRGGFGALGSVDSLTYWYIGNSYSDPTVKLYTYTNSRVVLAGANGYATFQQVATNQALFGRNIYYNDVNWYYTNTGYAQAIRMNDDIGRPTIAFHIAASGTGGGTPAGWDTSDVKFLVDDRAWVSIGNSKAMGNYALDVFSSSNAADWQSHFRNSYAGNVNVYLSHSDGHGIHVNTNNTSAATYGLQLHNGTIETFRVDGAGSVFVRLGLFANSTISVASTAAMSMFTGTKVGAGYSDTNGVFTAICDNPTGTSNYFFRGYRGGSGGTNSYAVRADGYIWSDGGMGTNGLISAQGGLIATDTLQVGSASTTATGVLVGNTSVGGRIWSLYSTGSASSIGAGKWGIYGGTYGYTIYGDNAGLITVPGTITVSGRAAFGTTVDTGCGLKLVNADVYGLRVESSAAAYNACSMKNTSTVATNAIFDMVSATTWSGTYNCSFFIGYNNTSTLAFQARVDGNCWSNGWNLISDRKLKDGIIPMESQWDSVKSMASKMSRFYMKLDESKTMKSGWVAQDLELDFADLVESIEGEKYDHQDWPVPLGGALPERDVTLTVKTTEASMRVTKAVGELLEWADEEVKPNITALLARMDSMELELAALRKRVQQ